MKDYFGPENVYEYIKFFDEHSDLEPEEIISKYIEKLTKPEWSLISSYLCNKFHHYKKIILR